MEFKQVFKLFEKKLLKHVIRDTYTCAQLNCYSRYLTSKQYTIDEFSPYSTFIYMMPFNGSNTVDLVLKPIELINQTKINTCQQWGQFLKNMGGE